MLKKKIAALALGLLGTAASAETLTFSYQNFYDSANGVYLPDFEVTGKVKVNDNNLDGIFTKDEVVSFHFGSIWLDPDNSIDYGTALCGGRQYVSWCLKEFSYSAADGLHFKAEERFADEAWYTGTEVVSGQYYRTWAGDRRRTLEWIPETRLTISPVPEPATYAMLGLGLAVLAAGRRRRQAA